MSDENKNSLAAAFAHAAAAFAATPLPYLVGMGVVLAATHWDGHLTSQKGCFEIQQIGAQYFKVDTCNGKVEALPVKMVTPPPTVPEKSAQKTVEGSKPMEAVDKTVSEHK